MSVISTCGYKSAFLRRLCLCGQSPHDALLEGEGVHRRFLYLRGISPFPCNCYRFTLLALLSVKEDLEFLPFLLVCGLTRHSLILSLNIAVYASKVIPFDTIMVSEIVCPPARANSLPFSNFFYQSGQGFRRVVGPHHLDRIFL